ncbi:MAG: alpha/beta hydrolase-fold protein [Sumerlaeia bacterium]
MTHLPMQHFPLSPLIVFFFLALASLAPAETPAAEAPAPKTSTTDSRGPATEPVRLEARFLTDYGQNIYVLGNIPELGGGEFLKALKLSPTSYTPSDPLWFVELEVEPGQQLSYRYLRLDGGPQSLYEGSNSTFLDGRPRAMTVEGPLPAKRDGFLRYHSGAKSPALAILNSRGAVVMRIQMTDSGPGRHDGERLWTAHLRDLPPVGQTWRFFIELNDGANMDAPPGESWYETALASLWLQDGQIFNYEPPASVSPSHVAKVADFPDFRPGLQRPLYIYTPRGYQENTGKHYPVLFMHDGENSFTWFVEGISGTSWQADKTADWLMRNGLIRECIIVGVRSGPSRLQDYLPPYASLVIGQGEADKMAAFYQDTVMAYMRENYRLLEGREHVATCGSSMGGLFSTYLAWEHPDFAKHHAFVSPAYWITQAGGSRGDGETLRRLRYDEPRDIRIYMDSGTVSEFQFPAPDIKDDGVDETYEARDALIANGYAIGPGFQHHVAYHAKHNENAWADRFPAILQFLFPVYQEPEAPTPPKNTGVTGYPRQ